MKVTIEGDLDQVADIVAPKRYRPPRGTGYVAERNRIIAEQASTLIRAFKLIRHDPAAVELKQAFLDALTGREERTKTIMDTARKVIAQRSYGVPPA